MIIGDNRKAVIENIKQSAKSGQFHNKVELTDPVLTPEQSKKITDNYLEDRNSLTYKAKKAVNWHYFSFCDFDRKTIVFYRWIC